MAIYQIPVTFITGDRGCCGFLTRDITIVHDSLMITGGELVGLIKKALKKSEYFAMHIIDSTKFQSDPGYATAIMPDRNGMLNLDTLTNASLVREFSVHVEKMPDFDDMDLTKPMMKLS